MGMWIVGNIIAAMIITGIRLTTASEERKPLWQTFKEDQRLWVLGLADLIFLGVSLWG
ncbi:MAG: hypothetical protein RL023_605 [Candidatus Parcubacteria bacterium]|jgi:hypothetical protein